MDKNLLPCIIGYASSIKLDGGDDWLVVEITG